MAINVSRQYLICYDIANPKRLAKVHRYLIKCTMPVQYSVFTAYLKQRELEAIFEDLAQIINSREDDIRAYPLPPSPKIITLGASIVPSNIMLIYENGKTLNIG